MIGAVERVADRSRGARRGFERYAPGEFTPGQIETVVPLVQARCGAAIAHIEERELLREERDESRLAPGRRRHGRAGDRHRRPGRAQTRRRSTGKTTRCLLRIYQRMQGPLRARQRNRARTSTCSSTRRRTCRRSSSRSCSVPRARDSVTLAGDVAQRLLLDNGFSDWKSVLDVLGLAHVADRAAARHVSLDARDHGLRQRRARALGERRARAAPRATACRSSCSASRIPATRSASWPSRCARWSGSEPLASVAVIARTPEQVRDYAEACATPRCRTCA